MYFRFLRAPRSIRVLASTPSTSQPITAASIRMPPTPQKGSANFSPGLALARLTMHRAIFGGIVDGWNTGRFRGLLGAIRPDGFLTPDMPNMNWVPYSMQAKV